jgi:hypothetical protein
MIIGVPLKHAFVRTFRAVVWEPSTRTPTGRFFVQETMRMTRRRARGPLRTGAQGPLGRLGTPVTISGG